MSFHLDTVQTSCRCPLAVATFTGPAIGDRCTRRRGCPDHATRRAGAVEAELDAGVGGGREPWLPLLWGSSALCAAAADILRDRSNSELKPPTELAETRPPAGAALPGVIGSPFVRKLRGRQKHGSKENCHRDRARVTVAALTSISPLERLVSRQEGTHSGSAGPLEYLPRAEAVYSGVRGPKPH